MKDIFNVKYKVEPSSLQVYHIITQLPWLLKFFMGFVVDSDIVKNRNHYLLVFGVIGILMQALIFLNLTNSPQTTGLAMFMYNIAGAFLDTTINSLIVQQARLRDNTNGHQDLQCFNSINFGSA